MKATGKMHENGSNSVEEVSLEVTQSTRLEASAAREGLILSAIMLISAEGIAISVSMFAGVLVEGALLLGFVTYACLTKSRQVRQSYLALSFIPLVRLLSITMAIPRLLPYAQYALIGIPILVPALIVNRRESSSELQTQAGRMRFLWQIVFAGIGIPLGFAAFYVLPKQTQLFFPSSPQFTLLVWVSLTLFTSVTEEVVFRGVLLKALRPSLGFFSVVISSLVYASMFIGTLSLPTMIFYLLLGLILGAWAQRTRSIAGPILAHVLMNGLVLVLLFFG